MNKVFFCLFLLYTSNSYSQNYSSYPYLDGIKYGVSDKKGNIILSPIYDKVERDYYWKNHFEATKNDSIFLVNPEGMIIYKSKSKSTSSNKIFENTRDENISLNRKLDFSANNKNFTTLFLFNNGILTIKTFPSFEEFKNRHSINRYYLNEYLYENNAIPVAIDSNSMNFVDHNLNLIFTDSFVDGFCINKQLFALAKEQGKYNLYNRAGSRLSSSFFSEAIPTHRDDYAILVRGFEYDRESTLFTPSGKEIKLVIKNFKSFSDSVLYGFDSQSQKYILYNYEGKSLNISLLEVYDKQYNLTMCKAENSNWGLMNDNAQWVLSPKYTILEYQDDGRYTFGREGFCGMIDSTGKIIFQIEGDKIDGKYRSNYFKYFKDNKCGIVDTLGQILLKPIYDDVYISKKEGTTYFLVKENGKWGILNSEKDILIPSEFDKIDFIHLEATKGKSQYKIDLINKKANQIYTNPKSFELDKKLQRLIDTEGNFVSNELYTDVTILNSNSEKNFMYALQNKKNKRFYINEVYGYEGIQIIPQGYQYKDSDFNKVGLAFILSESSDEHGNSKIGLVNTNGKLIVGPSKNPFYLVGESLICEYDPRTKTTTLYTLEGKKHAKQYPFIYFKPNKSITRFGVHKPNSTVKPIGKDQKYAENISDCDPNYLYGYLDKAGNEITAPKYNELTDFKKFGIGKRTENGASVYEIINEKGNVFYKTVNALKYIDVPPLSDENSTEEIVDLKNHLVLFEKKAGKTQNLTFVGLMTLSGEVKIPAEYENITYNDNMYTLTKAGTKIILDIKFRKIEEFNDTQENIYKLSNSYYYFKTGTQYTVVDVKTNKKILIPGLPLLIYDSEPDLLFAGTYDLPFFVKLDTGIVFKSRN